MWRCTTYHVNLHVRLTFGVPVFLRLVDSRIIFHWIPGRFRNPSLYSLWPKSSVYWLSIFWVRDIVCKIGFIFYYYTRILTDFLEKRDRIKPPNTQLLLKCPDHSDRVLKGLVTEKKSHEVHERFVS